jgi:hypothetical protein
MTTSNQSAEQCNRKIEGSLATARSYHAKHPDRFIFPLGAGRKGRPLITDNLNRASNDPEQIEKWAKRFPGCWWGLSNKKCGLVVLDADFGNGKKGKESLRALIAAGCVIPKTEMQQSPSGGFHYVFKGDHRFSASKVGEHLDTPNYIVIFGCTREDGTGYTLLKDRPALPAPAWLADKLKPVERAPAEPVGDPIPIEHFKRMLEATPYTGGPEGLTDRHGQEGWLAFMMACHHAAAGDEGEYMAEFIEWSLADPDAMPHWTAESIERRWQSLRADPPADGSSITTRASWFKLLDHLGNGDLIGPATAAGDFANDPPPPLTPAEMAERLRITEARRAALSVQPVRNYGDLIKNFVYIGLQKRWVHEPDASLWDKEGFDRYFANIKFPNTPQGKARPTEFLLALPHGHAHGCRRYQTMTYMPGAPGVIGHAFNFYTPSDIVAAKGDTSIWDAHLEYLFPNEPDRKVVLDWLAWVLQNLSRKPKHALLIHGEHQGTGKSWIADVFTRLIGKQNTTPGDQATLERQHNGFMLHCKLLTIEELRGLGPNSKAAKELHNMISQESVNIDEKNMPPFTLDQVMAILLMTNSRRAIRADDTDRRYAIVSTDAVPHDQAYYVRLFDLLDDKAALAAIAWQLLHRELGTYTAAGRAPNTLAKREMTANSSGDLEQWMIENADNAPLCYRLVSIDEIIQRLPADLRQGKQGALRGDVRDVLTRKFNGLAHPEQIRPNGRNGDKLRVWAIGPDAETVAETMHGNLADIYRRERPTNGSGGGFDVG